MFLAKLHSRTSQPEVPLIQMYYIKYLFKSLVWPDRFHEPPVVTCGRYETGISSHKMRLDPQCNSLVVIEGWRASGLPMFTEARTVLQGHMQIICCTAILVFARRINPCSTGVEGWKRCSVPLRPFVPLSRTSEHHHPNIFVLSQEQHLRLNRRRWKNEMMEG